VCDCPPELKFNVDAIDILIRSHLINMREFDLHLVQVCLFFSYLFELIHVIGFGLGHRLRILKQTRGLVSKETVVLRRWGLKHKILDLSTELIR